MPDVAETVRFYLRVREDRDQLKAELKKKNDLVGFYENKLIEELISDGISKMTQNGSTVYLRREMAVKHKAGTLETARALEAMGLKDLLTPSAQRLKAWLKEQMYREDVDEWDPNRLPEELDHCLDVSEFTRLGCRKG